MNIGARGRVVLVLAFLAAAAEAFAAKAPITAPGAASEISKEAAEAEKVQASTTAATASVDTIYTVEQLRDPFIRWFTGPGVKKIAGDEFSIHNLSLRALMKDEAVDYALFTDATGATYIFRKGKLYNKKGKLMAGVSGVLDIKRKMISLMTPDKDVQVFRLGEEEKESNL